MLFSKRGVRSRGAPDRYFKVHRSPFTAFSIQAIAQPESAAIVAVKRFPDAKTGAFDATNTKFSQEFPIRGYEAEPNQHASMVTIANLLQELAGNHAVGMWGRAEKGFASLPNAPDIIFVMTRLQVRMTEYPRWGDIVEMETYFNEESRLSARREWIISLPGSKKKIGAATSTWVNINMSTRRITKLPDELKEPLRRLAAPESLHSIPVEETKKKLQEFDRGSGVKSIAQIARRSDMDMNGHINNVVYIAWALESIPSAVYDAYHLHEIEVDFKAECKAGDTVQSYVHQLAEHREAVASSNGNGNGNGKKAAEAAEVVFLHMLERCDEEGCTELVRARSTWRKI